MTPSLGWNFDEDEEEEDGLVQPGNDVSDIKMMEIIGRGGFGSVFKAFWRGKICAVKVLEHGEDLMGFSDPKSKEKADADASGRRSRVPAAANHAAIMSATPWCERIPGSTPLSASRWEIPES